MTECNIRVLFLHDLSCIRRKILAFSLFLIISEKEDPGAFAIPYNIGLLHFAKELCIVGASINFVPLSNSTKLGSGDPKPSAIHLLKVDRN